MCLGLGEQKADGERCLSEAVGLMKGYVFETLIMNRVWLYVDATEAQTINLLERQGFSREATLRQDRYRNGRYSDTIVMGQVRGETKGE